MTREFLPPSLLPLKEKDWKLVPERLLNKSENSGENKNSWNQTKAAFCQQTKQMSNGKPTNSKRTCWNQVTIHTKVHTLPLCSPELFPSSTPGLLILTLLRISRKAHGGRRVRGFLGRDFAPGESLEHVQWPWPSYGCFDSAPGCPGCLSC